MLACYLHCKLFIVLMLVYFAIFIMSKSVKNPNISEELRPYIKIDTKSGKLECKIQINEDRFCSKMFNAYHKGNILAHIQSCHLQTYDAIAKSKQDVADQQNRGQLKLPRLVSSAARSLAFPSTSATVTRPSTPSSGSSTCGEGAPSSPASSIESGSTNSSEVIVTPTRLARLYDVNRTPTASPTSTGHTTPLLGKRNFAQMSSTSPSVTKYFDKEYINCKMSKSTFYSSCVELVTVNGRPFSLMNDSGFHRIVDPILKALGPNECIDRKKVSKMVGNAASILTAYITDRFQNQLVNLKLDAVSRLDRKFIAVNAQSVTEYALEITSLGLIECPQSHTGEYIANELLKILKTFNIEIEQVHSLTVDNGRNVLKATKILDFKLIGLLQLNVENQNDKSTTDESYESDDGEKDMSEYLVIDDMTDMAEAEEEFFETIKSAVNMLQEQCPNHTILFNTVNCVAHTLQLAVRDAIDLVLGKKNATIAKARIMLKKLRTPNLIWEVKINNLNKPELDIEPRWSTMYNMLVSAISFRDFCSTREKKYSEFRLLKSEWDLLETYVSCLKPAKIATDKLQLEQLTVGDMYSAWNVCLISLQQIDHRLAKALYSAMKNREPIIFENPVICAAMYLDPRTHVTLNDEQRKTAVNHLVVVAGRLHSLRQQNFEQIQSIPSDDECSPTIASPTTQADSLDPQELFIAKMKARFSEYSKNIEPSPSKEKATNYLNDVKRKIEQFTIHRFFNPDENIIKYWYEIGIENPELFQLAKVVLGVPPTQVSVERLFSSLKYIFSHLRCKLSAETIRDVMLLRMNGVFLKKQGIKLF